MKEWHFFDKVYRVWVVVCVGKFDDFMFWLESVGYKNHKELVVGSGYTVRLDGQSTGTNQNCYAVWLSNRDTGTLVHELSHLVAMVFNEKGIDISLHNTEQFAYYLEFWFNEIRSVMKKYPKGRPHTKVQK